jgi:hypothetical protein
MNNFYDWEGILAMKGLREAGVAYAMSDAPGCLEDEAEHGVRPYLGLGCN